MHRSKDNRGQGESPQEQPGREDLDALFDSADPLSGLRSREVSAALTPEALRILCTQTLENLGIRAPVDAAYILKPLRALHDRRVLFVDDSSEVLTRFVPALISVTNGSASFIHHQAQRQPALVAEILKAKPDLVLLDGQLAAGVLGWDVCRELHRKKPQIPVIGFSSEPGFERHFLSHDAMGFVTKRREDVRGSLNEINAQAALLFESL